MHFANLHFYFCHRATQIPSLYIRGNHHAALGIFVHDLVNRTCQLYIGNLIQRNQLSIGRTDLGIANGLQIAALSVSSSKQYIK